MANASLTELFPTTFLNESTSHQNLGESFQICENGNMVFHWADFHETCDSVKSQLQHDSKLKDEFEQKEIALNRQAHIPVWIRTDKKVHQTTMFELYERHILNQIELSLGIDPFEAIEISFISGTGPFRSMAIAECFNKSTYKDFVMLYLLKAKLPRRSYRIRLKSKVLVEYGQDFAQAQLVSLEQLTMDGILLSVDSDFYAQSIATQGEVKFLMDTNCLKEAKDKSLCDIKSHLSQYAFNLMYSSRKDDSFTCKTSDFSVKSSFDFLKNRKVFIFVPYSKLSGNQKVKDVQEFVGHTRELIRTHFQAKALTRSA